MTRTSFEESIKLSLKHTFMTYKKFISLDTFVKKISRVKNVNLISVFDCCRETKLKGRTMTEEEIEARKL